ncbi:MULTISPECIES: sulfur dioxygenase subunit alpha Sdo [Acidithiobacillus]|jgi:glyoxylase-like metal-dependent hydrolase (beta-lactamase superfamily II)|uniref:Metallo-beta-lactamase family protein n=2 Tax=Acidithiobacillus ferrooxidans TaxID=920 RepID=B7J413_ACIF2|nr:MULTISPECIES: sulfur dioxygenase subunit alpha Sdo [Acidithiobacillus]EGQ62116.1 metallo-beta-lactamase family protein [Acidithiobacillus sp. GGI-221]ACH82700.1 beta-lactamase domain protein [Acidithiobacillus ferrooxidans ATCC 53993]ACK79351.1 metallo-beta-lactamase family protein [Acidithiobacillus ferrooxidans ATCC 23270]MBN6745533.1 sulfur dioxygenase subunit alpha Sdo [Acidithiobacillus sp. MC2.2]MBN6748402.1 sulfur dioxygenase subunit alpha Sdo [Acidithiobacillus sp. PG05]
MLFRQLLETETSTYTYILGDPTWHEAVVIDPVLETVDEVLRILDRESMRLAYVLDTHVHADHVTGAGALRARTGAQVVISRGAAAPCADVLVDDDDFIVLGDDVIRVISTPGHTPGCVSYRWRDRVFTGDALLIGGCGRTDFQGGDAGALYDSITGKIFTLRDETLVYPGHDYAGRHVSCIGEEKRMNRRLAGKSREEFIAIMAELHLSEPKKIHVAVPANQRCGALSV